MIRDDRGSTIPLILGFFVLAMLLVAGTVAASDAFVRQNGLQDVCDGAAAAAAAGAADLTRDTTLTGGESAPLIRVQASVQDYLDRDPARRHVQASASLTDSARRLDLTCTETVPVTFGAVFGRGHGIRHVVHASARATLF